MRYLGQVVHTQVVSFLGVAAGFCATLVLARHLLAADYGSWVLMKGLLAFGTLFFSQNLYAYARLRIPGAPESEQVGYLKTLLLIVLACFVAAAALANLLPGAWKFISALAGVPYRDFGFLLLLLGFELIIVETGRYFTAVRKIETANTARFVQKTVFLTAVLAGMARELTVSHVLWAFFASQIVSFLIFFRAGIRGFLKAPFMWDVIFRGYRCALPVFPVSLAVMLSTYADRVMLNHFKGAAEVARYGLVFNFVDLGMLLIGGAVVAAIFPYAVESHNQSRLSRRDYFLLQMLLVGTTLSIIFMALMAINGDFLIDWITHGKYGDCGGLVLILCGMPLLHVIYSVGFYGLQILGFVVAPAMAFVVVFSVNLGLNFLLIPAHGSLGAAGATAITFFLFCAAIMGIWKYSGMNPFGLLDPGPLVRNLSKVGAMVLLAVSLKLVFYLEPAASSGPVVFLRNLSAGGTRGRILAGAVNLPVVAVLVYLLRAAGFLRRTHLKALKEFFRRNG